MPPAAERGECHVGTFLPYWRDTAFGTLFLVDNNLTRTMFIFPRSLVAPLLALAMVAVLVALDSLVDLSALL